MKIKQFNYTCLYETIYITQFWRLRIFPDSFPLTWVFSKIYRMIFICDLNNLENVHMMQTKTIIIIINMRQKQYTTIYNIYKTFFFPILHCRKKNEIKYRPLNCGATQPIALPCNFPGLWTISKLYCWRHNAQRINREFDPIILFKKVNELWSVWILNFWPSK